jgi:hypothetical protein
MKKIFLAIYLIVVSCHLFAQNLRVMEPNTLQYPNIEITIYDRNPELWKEGDVQLVEGDATIDSIEIQSIKTETRNHKMVFILFENSHFRSFDRQRDYFKMFIDEVLDTLSIGDKLYFSEFAWTLPDGNVLDPKKINQGDKIRIRQVISRIKPPETDVRVHQSTELNKALFEALEYLDGVKNDSDYDKVVIVFSGEFSNIYNANPNPESIIISSRKKNIPIYSVRYPRVNGKYSLKNTVHDTYGESLKIDLAKDFYKQTDQFKEILARINERSAGCKYIIRYTTEEDLGTNGVVLTISKQQEPVTYKTIFFTPSYLEYIMLDGTRKLLAIIGLLLVLLLFGLLIFFFRQKQKSKKLLNDQRLKSIEDESRKRVNEQNQQLEDLRKERDIQEGNFRRTEEERVAKKYHEESRLRFLQMVRPPILVGAEGIQYQLARTNVIGRSKAEGCDLVIQDPTVSKKHGCILYERYTLDDVPEPSNIFVYVDLGSTNGSFVNNKPINKPVILKNGDVLRLGGVQFTFRI